MKSKQKFLSSKKNKKESSRVSKKNQVWRFLFFQIKRFVFLIFTFSWIFKELGLLSARYLQNIWSKRADRHIYFKLYEQFTLPKTLFYSNLFEFIRIYPSSELLSSQPTRNPLLNISILLNPVCNATWLFNTTNYPYPYLYLLAFPPSYIWQRQKIEPLIQRKVPILKSP